jgi:hypothetical protein
MGSDNPTKVVALCRCGLVGWFCFGVTLLWLLIGVTYQAAAQNAITTADKRVALVIGISKYQYAPALQIRQTMRAALPRHYVISISRSMKSMARTITP